MRLDKFLSSQGVCSRSDAKRLIRAGRVTVNGAHALSGADIISPDEDKMTLDGEILSYKAHCYIMMNKPAGVLSATRDKQPTVLGLLPKALNRPGLFPAGRLDKDTTGLLIITDDGDFAHRLLAPAGHIKKVYHAVIDCPLPENAAEKFAMGVVLADGTHCLPAGLSVLSAGENPTVQITVFEGKYHQVKRMLGVLGAGVCSLCRVKIGGVELDKTLPVGGCREMTAEEINLIFNRRTDS